MKNLTLENLTKVCGGVYFGPSDKLEQEVSSITTDSRKAEAGTLFVPIVGERVDAHKFIPQVMEAGALATLSERILENADFPYIKVESSLQAVKDIAEFYLQQLQIPVVGITGSVGKTSTKEVIASVLKEKYRTLKTQGNFNNELGLPLTVFRLRDEDEIAVLEMGISDFGEMTRLAKIARPDTCVITNIGIAHLEFFKTREGILQEKSQMIQDMKNGGSIILNGDDDLLCKMSPVKGVAPVFFGTGSNCAFRADNIEPQGLRGTSCTITLKDGTSFDCLVPVPGIHMVSNAIAGAAVGYTLGLTASEIKAGIESLPSIPGRNHIIETDHMIILDDCYNANPISMKASIDVLNMAIGRRVAVLGNMGELGDTAEVLHAEVGTYAAQQNVDLVCGIGDLTHALVEEASRGTHTQALWFADNESFIQAIPDIIKDGDNVLVKASHGMNFPQIVHALEEL